MARLKIARFSITRVDLAEIVDGGYKLQEVRRIMSAKIDEGIKAKATRNTDADKKRDRFIKISFF